MSDHQNIHIQTTKISSPNQNRNMPQRYLNNCRHLRVAIPETLYPLSPFRKNKSRVRNHEGHELLTLRSIIIHHAFCGFTKLRMWKHVASVKNFTRVVTLFVVRTTKKILGPPDLLSWWSCGPLLIKVCVKP